MPAQSGESPRKMAKFIEDFKEKSDKYIPIVFNCLIIIFCMCTFFPLGSIANYFRGECVLYAEPSVQTLTISKSNFTMLLLNMKSTVWGETSNCDYTTYTPVVVAVYIFIWLWFRIQLRSSVYDEGYVLGAMLIGGIMNVILFVVLFITSCILVAGSSHFCSHIEESLKGRILLFSIMSSILKRDNIGYKCSDTQNMLWSVYNDGKLHPFYNYLQLAQASSWITLVILGLQIAYNIRKGLQMLTDDDDTDNESSLGSDDDSFREGSYKNHEYNEETGSIRFHIKRRKESERSDEEFLLPL